MRKYEKEMRKVLVQVQEKESVAATISSRALVRR
jgi:hypothetical protein